MCREPCSTTKLLVKLIYTSQLLIWSKCGIHRFPVLWAQTPSGVFISHESWSNDAYVKDRYTSCKLQVGVYLARSY